MKIVVLSLVLFSLSMPNETVARSKLEFEVASVKPADPNVRGQMIRFMPGGGVTIVGATLKSIIEVAYDVDRLQVTGPGWIESERFEILAKSPVEPESQTREKLRNLLAERFHLAIHRESKELPVLNLTVTKNGSKMKESMDDKGISRESIGRLTGHGASLSVLANVLTSLLRTKFSIERASRRNTNSRWNGRRKRVPSRSRKACRLPRRQELLPNPRAAPSLLRFRNNLA